MLNLPIIRGVTIDALHSRDLDDAILVEKHDIGWNIYVSIANIADNLTVASKDDRQAQERLVTIYSKENIRKPMLPRYYCENLTLEGSKTKSVITFKIILDKRLHLIDFTVFRALFESDGRLNYRQISKIINEKTEHYKHMSNALELAEKLRTARLNHGAFLIEDPDEQRNLSQKYSSTEYWGHLIISELMILANSCAALYAKKNNIPILYRNHTSLEIDSKIYTQIVKNTNSLYLELINITIDQTKMDKAKYENTCFGHAGLGLVAYGHFTSPLRRYVDIINQRSLLGIDNKIDYENFGKMITASILEINTKRGEGLKEIDQAKSLLAIEETKFLIPGDNEITIFDKQTSQFFERTLLRHTKELDTNKAFLLTTQKRLMDLSYFAYAGLLTSEIKNKELLQSILKILETDSKTILNVINIAKSSFHLEESTDIIELNSKFMATSEFTLNENKYYGVATGENKREAKINAYIFALYSMVGIELDIFKTPVSLEDKPIIIAEDYKEFVNSRNILSELCQKFGWQTPTYTITSKEYGNFVCTGTLQTTQNIYVEKISGKNKKDSIQKTSAKLLACFNETQESEENLNKSIYTNQINKLHGKNKITNLSYKEIKTENTYSTHISFFIKENKFEAVGIGKSKKKAKHNASKQAFEIIPKEIWI